MLLAHPVSSHLICQVEISPEARCSSKFIEMVSQLTRAVTQVSRRLPRPWRTLTEVEKWRRWIYRTMRRYSAQERRSAARKFRHATRA